MTTKVTIDAHAGWPVQVEIKDEFASGATEQRVEIVAPNTVREFFVFDTRHLVIREMKKEG